jgi:hypothetical protein
MLTNVETALELENELILLLENGDILILEGPPTSYIEAQVNTNFTI